jgi:hypothetical protein
VQCAGNNSPEYLYWTVSVWMLPFGWDHNRLVEQIQVSWDPSICMMLAGAACIIVQGFETLVISSRPQGNVWKEPGAVKFFLSSVKEDRCHLDIWMLPLLLGYRAIVVRMWTDVSKERITSIFRASKAGEPPLRWFLARLIFEPKDGCDTFLRNVRRHTDYTELYPRWWQHS